MGKRIPEIDVYIANAAPFARPILKRIRVLMHRGCPAVEERIRWGAPHFDSDDSGRSMIGGMAAFKAHVSIGFWRAGELDDPARLFRHTGSSMMNLRRMASLADLPDDTVLLDYIRRAVALNEAGPARKAPSKRTSKLPAMVPDDLAIALAASSAASNTFDGFPAGQRREYIDWIAGAKRDQTRQRRITQAIEWLAEGKRRNWKYENC